MRANVLLLFSVLLIFITGCNDYKNNVNNVDDFEETSEEPTIKGAWEMVSFINYRDDGAIDSIKSNDNFKQMKMFTDNKIMWSRLRTWDSVDWFGVGNYTFKDGILTEDLEYGSKSMMDRIKMDKPWDWEVIIDKNTFTQITRDTLGQPVYAEVYNRVN